MTAFLIENIGPLMFGTLVIVLLLGYPVAFSLAAVGIGYAILGIYLGLLTPRCSRALPERVWGVMSNDTLLCVPFFTFMGLILERSGMAEDLLDTIGQVFGPVRGGLAYAVIFVGALLAATTGVVAASVISMGLISLPIMLRYGYDRRFASGVIAASGTLAQIIPPSLVLIIMADQLGKSVGDMYAGAFIPGITLAGLYALYATGVCVVKPQWAPALPLEARTLREPDGAGGTRSLLVIDHRRRRQRGRFRSLGIWSQRSDRRDARRRDQRRYRRGILRRGDQPHLQVRAALAAGRAGRVRADSAAGADLPGAGHDISRHRDAYRGWRDGRHGCADHGAGTRTNFVKLLRQAMDTTAKLSTFVVFILLGARVFSLTFYGVNGHVWVEHLLLHLPGGQLGFLIVVNILIFVLAFFLDFFELSFIIIPLVGPVADKLGIDLIWFGVLLGRQHADVVHASALRLRAVLPPQRGAGQGLSRQAHRQAHAPRDYRPNLLGCGAVRADPDRHGRAGHQLPADGDGVQGEGEHHRSDQDSDPAAAYRDDAEW